jgi:acyl carrier protein
MSEPKIVTGLIKLLKQIAPDKPVEQLKPEDQIRKKLALDSFDFLQFIIALDEMFKIKTPEEHYHKLETLRDVVLYIEQNQPAA